MNGHNIQSTSVNTKSRVATAGLILGLALLIAQPAAAIVLNGNFEANTLANGGFQFPINNWTNAPANTIGLFDPDTNRMSSQGGDNNTVVLYTANASLRQTLSVNLENLKTYTLTIQAGADSSMTGPNPTYPFPALGNGVSTGNVLARLMANAGASAMPGFVPGMSSVSTPTLGNFTNWTLVWQTGASEPLAGTALVVDLRILTGLPGNNESAYFDNVALTVGPIPEPSAAILVVAGGALLLRRRVRGR
jgi:hypothetical protein